ncbi:MAG: hypothetical protein IJX93_11000 [Clostridia bacterium]|nr:hypothetical protein [Clostridia bacterium]MBQ8334285.1 hypothetical protein [Clostridia bacterium]MBQ8369678.1 hypothetical protein [Clostridia bacterium]MBQ8512385.1 hypothetical protein [Clostridia bacterium]
MKNKKLIAGFAAALAVVSALGIAVGAAYDSSENPLITLTYLTNIFKVELLDEVDERLEALEARLDDSRGEDIWYPETEAEVVTPTVVEHYDVVELHYGDALYAVSACDIMLRAGQATCIAPDPTQGISNYTVGAEIYNGEYLTKNHMCLIPRGDGRGVLAQTESVFFMVKGDYTIVEG